MPNWCLTTYKCIGEKKEVFKLYNTIKKMDRGKESVLPNGFGKLWLGNLVHLLGGDWEKIYCRGEITSYCYRAREDCLVIDMMTAWTEPCDTRHFIESVFPGIKIYYTAEELGNEVFCTNDSSGEIFPERFLLDYEDGTQYFNTLEGAVKFISSEIGQPIKATNTDDVNHVINEWVFKNRDDDFVFQLYEMEVVDD